MELFSKRKTLFFVLIVVLLALLAILFRGPRTPSSAGSGTPPVSTFAALTCIANQPCTRVLFLGNSYTLVNDLPVTFAQLAGSGGERVKVGMLAKGGETLAQHAADPETLKTINAEHWSYVVLQEQSETPASVSLRTNQMYPAARTLVEEIRAAGVVPLFFLTWGHRNGWPETGLTTYASMQDALNQGYMDIANELVVAVVPVGMAWSQVVTTTNIAMWQNDGSHPTAAGTYLTACVFYAAIFNRSPVGLTYHSILSDAQAQALQQVAAQIVLTNRSQWNLPNSNG